MVISPEITKKEKIPEIDIWKDKRKITGTVNLPKIFIQNNFPKHILNNCLFCLSIEDPVLDKFKKIIPDINIEWEEKKYLRTVVKKSGEIGHANLELKKDPYDKKTKWYLAMVYVHYSSVFRLVSYLYLINQHLLYNFPVKKKQAPYTDTFTSIDLRIERKKPEEKVKEWELGNIKQIRKDMKKLKTSKGELVKALAIGGRASQMPSLNFGFKFKTPLSYFDTKKDIIKTLEYWSTDEGTVKKIYNTSINYQKKFLKLVKKFYKKYIVFLTEYYINFIKEKEKKEFNQHYEKNFFKKYKKIRLKLLNDYIKLYKDSAKDTQLIRMEHKAKLNERLNNETEKALESLEKGKEFIEKISSYLKNPKKDESTKKELIKKSEKFLRGEIKTRIINHLKSDEVSEETEKMIKNYFREKLSIINILREMKILVRDYHPEKTKPLMPSMKRIKKVLTDKKTRPGIIKHNYESIYVLDTGFEDNEIKEIIITIGGLIAKYDKAISEEHPTIIKETLQNIKYKCTDISGFYFKINPVSIENKVIDKIKETIKKLGKS